MSATSWFLVSSSGNRHRLPREMIFVGREDCELMLQSRSVDKQHAVINFDSDKDEHWVKDLGSLNGTFVNDVRIPDQKYITLKLNDVIRFGYDANIYVLEQIQHKLPEEALKHEKYTSQLQMSVKGTSARRAEPSGENNGYSETQQAKLEKGEKKNTAEVPIYRTPLYGQPSWWGDDDANKLEGQEGRRPDEHSSERTKEMSQHEEEMNGHISGYRDSPEQPVYSFRREPSYFEIPTKDFQQPAKTPETQVHEIPTKDTDPATPPVVQSHASFTIEFDDDRPGKIKIKDHVTKFSLRQRRPLGKDPSHTEMMSAESKVVDWLVQNDPSLMRRPTPGDDVYSTKSDLSVHVRTVKVNQHEDGTQSDSEDPLLPNNEKDPVDSEHIVDQSKLQRQIRREPQDMLHNQQAFVIEFFDEDAPRKKRSQSFTQSAHSSQSDTDPALKAKLEKRKGTVPAEKSGNAVPQPVVGAPGSKPVSSSSGPQRSGSFRREKTDDRISSSSSSASKPPVKNYGSIGKKSKIAQEFAAEYLKEQAEAAKQSSEKQMTQLMAAPQLPPAASIALAPQMAPASHMIPAPYTTPAPPAMPSVPHKPISSHKPPALQIPSAAQASVLTSPRSTSPLDSKPTKGRKPEEEEDSLSETGTYTIETETQDTEVEEARKMIDQVFGIFESDDFSKMSGTYRPVIKGGKEDSDLPLHLMSEHMLNPSTAYPASTGYSQPADMQTRPVGPVNQGGQKWVSRWASLADSYTDSGPVSMMLDVQQGLASEDFSEGAVHNKSFPVESEMALPSRTRRLLPQLPPSEKSDSPTPATLICPDSYSEGSERNVAKRNKKASRGRLPFRDDLDPDSLSDSSNSDDGRRAEKDQKYEDLNEIAERRLQMGKDCTSERRLQAGQRVSKTESHSKGTSFYIETENNDVGSSLKAPFAGSRTLVDTEYKTHEYPIKPSSGKQPTQECNGTLVSTAGKLTISLHQSLPHERESVATKDPLSFLRQESFTKDKSSNNVPQNKLPHISTHPLLKDLEATKSSYMDYSQETQFILKETETALAALEAKILSQSHRLDSSENNTHQQDDSLSGDSDVDTASTVSLVSSKNAPSHAPTRRGTSSLQKEKSSSTPSIKDQCNQPSARERLSEKRRTVPSEAVSREGTKRFQMKRSTGARGSLDFTDDDRNSSLPYLTSNENASSDYEHPVSRSASRRKPMSQSTREDSTRNASSAQKIQQVLTRSNSLSTPRATRASKLRRARLGEASDNDCADADKVLLNNELSITNSASSKQSAEARKLSRLDILAMPRKRTGSFTTPSDSETATPRSGFSGRSVESSSRKPVMAEVKPAARKSIPPTPKQPLSRARPGGVRYSSSSTSRRRQQGSDYTSTSDEEYGSKNSTPKHKRSHTSTATQTPRPLTSGSHRHKRAGEEEYEDYDDEPDAYHNLMAQTAEIAEIARLSQTLVKDVAILAREIHDVAGDGDSQSSSGTGPSTSLSSLTNTPASNISAREELVQHIPEASLNYQKVPPGSLSYKDYDQNMNDSREEDLTRRRSRNREEVIFDNLMLNPVSQLSHAIRANTENLAEKMKILFQNREKSWEEIEAKINSENEVPILKTSNKEISCILKELRRVQKQLEVINAIIDPTGHLEVIASNKTSPAPMQSAASRVRTMNVAAVDSKAPVPTRIYIQKLNYGPSGVKESKIVTDEEESYAV